MDNVDSSPPISFENSGSFEGVHNGTSAVTADTSQRFPGTSVVTGLRAMSTPATGRISPVRTYTMKDLEQQISDLKKENFGLKLRIYYMEEKMDQTFENDDNIKTNIELKVEAEHLKKELEDKSKLLLKASQAVECLAQEKEQLLQKQDENVNVSQIQKNYEDKLKEKDEENTRLKELESDLQRRLAEANEVREDLEKAIGEKSQERDAVTEDKQKSLAEKDREIGQLSTALRDKNDLITRLRGERADTENDLVKPLKAENEELRKHLEQTEDHAKEQQAKIRDLEEAVKDAKDELGVKDKENKDLENQLRSTQIAEMEASQALLLHDQEKQTLESNAMKSYKAIQKFVQTLREKEKEIGKLKAQLADKEREIDEARDGEVKKNEDLYLQLAEARQGASQEAKDNRAYYEGKLSENRVAAEAQKADLECQLKDKEGDIEKLNDELTEQKQKCKELENGMKDSDARNKHLAEAANSQVRAKEIEVEELKRSLNDKEDIVSSLKQSLAGKEAMIENLQELLEGQSKEDLFKQLTVKLKDKEKQLQEMVAERADVAKANEKTTRDMLDAIRDKDEQIKELNSDLSQQAIEHDRKVHDLERDLAKKGMKLEGAEDALARAEREQEGTLARMRRALDDKDKTIEKLMDSGREKDKLFLDMQQGQVHPGDGVQRLRDEVDGLKETIAGKNDEIRRLRSSLPEKGEVDSLMSELQHKNKMLENARSTIDQLQKPNEVDQHEILKQKRRIANLEAELDDRQRKLDAKAEELRESERAMRELRVDVNLAEYRQGKDSCTEDIHNDLKDQVRELRRLIDILNRERQLNVNITQKSDPSREAELATIQALCSQLGQRPSSDDTINTHEQTHDLPSHQRMQNGVGAQTQTGSPTRDDGMGRDLIGSPLPHRESLQNGPARELFATVAPPSSHGESRRSPSMRRSIPGQEDREMTALRERVKALEADLIVKKLEIDSLREQLGAGDSSHVVPVLKQQLDQAKALLGERDSQLQRAEQDCQTANQKVAELKDQKENLREVNEKLTRKMDGLNREIPQLKSQLERANALNRQTRRENASLREKLGIGEEENGGIPGRTVIDTLKAANAKLRGEVDELRGQLTDQEILRKRVEAADNMNDLLKKHIALNTSKDSARGVADFDPTLIVQLGQEVERLHRELEKAGIDVGEGDSPLEKGVMTTLQEQLAHCQKELRESAQSQKTLQQKLRATEGTAHLQADRIQRYRRQLHNHGLAPATTPKRVHSDSNLSMSRFRSTHQLTSDIEMLRSGGNFQESSSYADFGDSDDVAELKEQVEVLKNENDRCRRLTMSFHSQSGGSRSSTPSVSRSLSPERDTTGWFKEMSEEEGAVSKLRGEVADLRAQLQRANELNATIHDQYKDIQAEIEQAHTENPAQEQLKAKEREITVLLGYLEESKKLSDLMKQMLLEALRTMEDIKEAYDSLEGGKVVQRIEVTQGRIRNGVDIAESLHKALDECSTNSGRPTTPRTKSSFAESFKKKLKEISALQKELARSKKRNQSMSRLLQENQNTAEETREELKKLRDDILHKQQTIFKLQQQVQAMRRDRDLRSIGTQTATPGESDDLAQLYARLRENQLLVCTLKSELQVYRDVLHSKTPSGSPHSATKNHEGGSTTGEDTLKAYLEEVRSLRRQLEETTRDNERLKIQLEGNLAGPKDGSVHIEETNVQLTSRVEILNTKLREKDKTNQKLKDDYKKMKTEYMRIRTENKRLTDQLEENAQLQTSLRFELGVYEQMYPKEGTTGTPRVHDLKTGIDLTEILNEMRRLRIQLERSIDTNNALRCKLEEMTAGHWSVETKYREKRSSKSSSHSRRLFFNLDSASEHTDDTSPYEDTEYYDMPAAANRSAENGSCTGQFMVGSLLTYERLKKALRECKALLSAVTATLETGQWEKAGPHSPSQKQRPLLHKVSLLVDESSLLLLRFQREHLPRSEEINKLKRQIVAQQKLLKRMSLSNQSKDSIEDVIIKNLMEHEATLVRVQRNLEAKQTNSPVDRG